MHGRDLFCSLADGRECREGVSELHIAARNVFIKAIDHGSREEIHNV